MTKYEKEELELVIKRIRHDLSYLEDVLSTVVTEDPPETNKFLEARMLYEK